MVIYDDVKIEHGCVIGDNVRAVSFALFFFSCSALLPLAVPQLHRMHARAHVCTPPPLSLLHIIVHHHHLLSSFFTTPFLSFLVP